MRASLSFYVMSLAITGACSHRVVHREIPLSVPPERAILQRLPVPPSRRDIGRSAAPRRSTPRNRLIFQTGRRDRRPRWRFASHQTYLERRSKPGYFVGDVGHEHATPSRRRVGDRRTSASRGTPQAPRRSTPRPGPGRAHRHHLRAHDRHPVGVAAPGEGVRLRRDLLAASPRSGRTPASGTASRSPCSTGAERRAASMGTVPVWTAPVSRQTGGAPRLVPIPPLAAPRARTIM